MENARRGLIPSYSEMGHYTKTNPRRTQQSSNSRYCGSDAENLNSDKEINGRLKHSNKENISYKDTSTKRDKKDEQSESTFKNPSYSKRMDDLTARTRETLAVVERLANKNRESPKRTLELSNQYSLSKSKVSSSDQSSEERSNKKSFCKEQKGDLSRPYSILKKKSTEEIVVEVMHSPPTISTTPVSILKRKVSTDIKTEGSSLMTTHTPPVTFSPSVIEPATTNRKQGILKKRRSLDESQVLRHRSCSPDINNDKTNSRSILKTRRSSLEEIIRTNSPDPSIQGILKRRTSRNEEEQDQSLNSPQSILKRRSGASSAGSTSNSPHISIATAVILAAAGGAEIVLDNTDTVKPILKKKSFSEEHSYSEVGSGEALKPILKKKSSTETDESEERPKKPILKLYKSLQDSKDSDDSETPRSTSLFRHLYQSSNDSSSECEVKPILKQSTKEDSPRLRLSFSGDKELPTFDYSGVTLRRTSSARRPNSVCQDFDFDIGNGNVEKEEDRELKKPRPLSVSDLIMNFEQTSLNKGAIPKKSNMKRNSDRCRTQPITFNELEARYV